jgi:hypothetical protein
MVAYGKEFFMREVRGLMHGINFGGWLSQCVHTKEHYDTFII